MNPEIYDWEQAAEVFEHFCIWSGQPEMRWFKKAWQGFIGAGKATYSNDIEKHWVLAKIVTLGVMYNEFCYHAWDEGPDTDSCIGELKSDENIFNLVRLGSLLDKEWIDPDSDEYQMFIDAVNYLVSESRLVVYDLLIKIFGSQSSLFVSLWLSQDGEIQVGQYNDEIYDEILNHDLSGHKMAAFDYVNNGMMSIDC